MGVMGLGFPPGRVPGPNGSGCRVSRVSGYGVEWRRVRVGPGRVCLWVLGSARARGAGITQGLGVRVRVGPGQGLGRPG